MFLRSVSAPSAQEEEDDNRKRHGACVEDLHEGLHRSDLAVERALNLAQRAASLDQLSDEGLLRFALFVRLRLSFSAHLIFVCLLARRLSQLCDALFDLLQLFIERLLFESPSSFGFKSQALQVDERTIADPARTQA